jgi:hypothetical protein
MFQLFLRARVYNFLRSQSNNREFKTRLADRDAETDRVRIASIMAAIQTALDGAEKEKAGLSKRIDDALAFAAVTMGAATDEYLEREPLNDHHQSLFNSEIKNGERRLSELATMISHLKFIKAVMLTRFPDSKRPRPSSVRGE